MSIEPQIRYTKTSDGVSIAYQTQGAGEHLICTFSFIPFGHRAQEPGPALFDHAMAARFTVTHYDGRGTGLSDRAATDYSLEARLSDLGAVADAVGATRFSLYGEMYGGLAAIAFAARHPERIDRLILHGAIAEGLKFYEETEFGRLADALAGITVEQWEFVSRTVIARGAMPDTPPDVLARRTASMRDAWRPNDLLAFRDANRTIDVTPELALLRTPALVIQATQDNTTRKRAQKLARDIPGARLLVGKREWDGFHQATMDQMVRFLGAEPAEVEAAAPVSGIRTVLFTDIVGHTEMMQRLGDARGRDVLREHERITRETLRQHGGAEVKTMGDGFMASFGSVTSAMECAIALQRGFDGPLTLATGSRPASGRPSPTGGEGAGERIAIRIGLNAGEPIEEDGDLFGSTVILASRIAGQAGAGEILVPDTVRGLLSGKSFAFADRGEFALKGFDDAVRLFEVRWGE